MAKFKLSPGDIGFLMRGGLRLCELLKKPVDSLTESEKKEAEHITNRIESIKQKHEDNSKSTEPVDQHKNDTDF